MSAISITATSVAKGTGASTADGTAGASITAGQAIYLDSTTSTLKLADGDASMAAAACVGIALHAATSGQPLRYQTGGEMNIGATLTVGEIYVLGTTAGAVNPVGDLANPSYTTILGYGKSASVFVVNIVTAGVVRAGS